MNIIDKLLEEEATTGITLDTRSELARVKPLLSFKQIAYANAIIDRAKSAEPTAEGWKVGQAVKTATIEDGEVSSVNQYSRKATVMVFDGDTLVEEVEVPFDELIDSGK